MRPLKEFLFSTSPKHSVQTMTSVMSVVVLPLVWGGVVRVTTRFELRWCPAPEAPLTSDPRGHLPSDGQEETIFNERKKNIFHLTSFSSLPPLPLPSHQACAPLYSWRTKKDLPESDVTGTCYLSAQNFTKFAEYAPCRTGIINTIIMIQLICLC